MSVKDAKWGCLLLLAGCSSGATGEGPTERIESPVIDASKSVLTQHNDNLRTGAFLKETILTPATVQAGLRRLAQLPVDGQVYAQPLYVSGITMNGATRDVAYVATMHNSVYAFDATTLTQLWKKPLGSAFPIYSPLACAPAPVGDSHPPPTDPACAYTAPFFGRQYAPYHDISVEAGILSTPVIDATTQTMYLVRELVSTPAAAVGDPRAYTRPGEQHIVYRGKDNHIHEYWTDDEQWEHPRHNDLTVAARLTGTTQDAAGDPHGFTTENGVGQHVVYRGTDNNVWELYDSPTGWKRNTINVAAGSPTALGDPFGYDQGGVTHVVYRASDNGIYELYDSPTGWQKNKISVSGHAHDAASDPFAFVTDNGTVQHVVYRGTDSVVYELYENGGWDNTPISTRTGAPLAASKPTGYVTAGSMPHVVYRSADNNIWELYDDGGWKKSRINTPSGAPGGKGDPYGYATDAGATEHVVYRGTDNNVYELYNTGGNWLRSVLNRLPIPGKSVLLPAPQAGGSPFGYATATGQHVVYRDINANAFGDGYIQEVHDVTGWAGATPSLVLSHELVAIDITTGNVLRSTPIQGSVPGTGEGSVAGTLSFDSKRQLQRPSLALANNRVYVAFSGVADTPPYHGWVFAYNATTFAPSGIFSSTPGSAGGGIWMSGQGPAVDSSGAVYVVTSNSTADPQPTLGQNLGQAIVKFQPPNGTSLAIQDWFVPNNFQQLNSGQEDLSQSGLTLIPGTNRLYGGGIYGGFYLVDTGNMGHFITPDVPRKFQLTDPIPGYNGHVHGTPVFFDGDDGLGKRIYVWGENDQVRAFRYADDEFKVPAAKTSALIQDRLCLGNMPGGFLSVSANDRSTGVVWATHVYVSGGSGRGTQDRGILTAFRASTLEKLWDSEASGTTNLGLFGKYSAPTIAKGKVFVATNSNWVTVYGP